MPSGGRVWLRDEDPREGQELVFDFPFDDELNEIVKRLPRRWFDWRRKHWRVPADPRIARLVEQVLGRFPRLEPSPEVLAWLSESDRWRGVGTVVAHEGAGAFLVRTLSGDPPAALADAVPAGEGKLLLPFDSPRARRLGRLEGLNLDDLAVACARELEDGGEPAPAELTLEVGDHGEPDVTLYTLWDPSHAQAFKRLPEARLVHRTGRFFGRDGAWAVAVPADAALAEQLSAFVAERPALHVEEPVRELLDELVAEHEPRLGHGRALLRRRRRARRPGARAASCTPSSAPGSATRSHGAGRSSPTSRASARPCRRSPRSRPTTPSRPSWSARRA